MDDKHRVHAVRRNKQLIICNTHVTIPRSEHVARKGYITRNEHRNLSTYLNHSKIESNNESRVASFSLPPVLAPRIEVQLL